jgi:hypothetical protein
LVPMVIILLDLILFGLLWSSAWGGVQGEHENADSRGGPGADMGLGSAWWVRHGAVQRRGRRQHLRSVVTRRTGGGPDGSAVSWAAGGSKPKLGRTGEAGWAGRDFEPMKPREI